MKVLFFHLMPYPELPERYDREARSVWVDIDIDYLDRERMGQLYHAYLDQLEHAAEVGFDGICVNEHHQNAYGLMPSPNLMASSLARNTRRSAIVVMGNSIALYNPPLRVAEELAMIDCLSGGRLVAGFPVGTAMDTCYAYGVNPGELRRRYHEAHDLIVRGWTQREPFSFNGTYTKLRYVNPWPRPIQRPHPPIWVPGGGSIETWEWTAQQDYVYCYLSYFGYKLAQERLELFWKHIHQLGADDNPYRCGFLQFVGVAETDAQAREIYREPAEYFYSKLQGRVYPGFAGAPGYQSEATYRWNMTSAIRSARGLPGGQAPSFEEMIELGYVIVGGPERVREQLEDAARCLRVGHLMCLLHFGNMTPEVVRLNTDLFAREVMPSLQSLWSDYEDRWWPEACA